MATLATAASLPAVAMVPTGAFATGAPAALSSWHRLLAAWQTCHSEAETASRVCDKIGEDYEAAVKKVPHITIGYDCANKPITTACAVMLADARRTVSGVRYLENYPGNYERHRSAQKLLDAQERRFADMKRIDTRLGYSAAATACDDAWEREGEAKRRLMDMPAPNRAAALWKLEELFGPKQLEDEGGGIPPWTADYTAQFFDDVRRFLAN
ncbi:hypothetical protein [Sphingomonas sp.]|uniref:hypothetical protein n=1 Tax=Sphingomonas sp. TaxID=28214 RepID=UPI0025E3639B|nr:hypothetical protein [Sphingomonas sp.]MBV9528322.1 hypothetical protein [Sphingomonas sp.]